MVRPRARRRVRPTVSARLVSVATSVRALAACPQCGAEIDRLCHVPSGRNHTRRVHAALREALAQEADDRGLDAKKLGLRDS